MMRLHKKISKNVSHTAAQPYRKMLVHAWQLQNNGQYPTSLDIYIFSLRHSLLIYESLTNITKLIAD